MIHLDSILHQVKKPARYTGGEWNSITRDWDRTSLHFALIYPDLYEIGMSNMALPILYDILNNQPDVLAERAFAPWPDMEAAMRQARVPLYSLESGRPLKDFDVIGFSLGYELTYTNVLNILDLAGIPVFASERDDSCPLIIAGGSCVLNPEPLADFMDFFVVGDGEEVLFELLDGLRDSKGSPKKGLLRRMATIPGVYVPGFYQVDYEADGRVKSMSPTVPEARPVVQRRIVSVLPPPPTRPVVPYIEAVHDRAAIEIQRGCSHGCRFCQAGTIYRPVRERPFTEVVEAAGELLANTGYNELSLVSLSTSDYSNIDRLVLSLSQRYPDVAISLPSLYVNKSSVDLMDCLPDIKKTGLTLAPEAGSERLRRAINKNISEDELLQTAATAFERGWTGLKLYFMLGLPTETADDVYDIAGIIDKVRAMGKTRGRTPQIRATLSTFVPKPHTPFQWVAQGNAEEINWKHDLLKDALRRKGVKLSWQDSRVSQLEAALSRGDRQLGRVIYNAWKLGCRFDSWSEHLNLENWGRAFAEAGLDPAFYAGRTHALDEVLPWSHIDTGVTSAFLKREYERSLSGKETRDCRRNACNVCGLERLHAACQLKSNPAQSR